MIKAETVSAENAVCVMQQTDIETAVIGPITEYGAIATYRNDAVAISTTRVSTWESRGFDL